MHARPAGARESGNNVYGEWEGKRRRFPRVSVSDGRMFSDSSASQFRARRAVLTAI